MLFSLAERENRVRSVAIVGGGPAGATAAEKLAACRGPARQKKVTVFEERLGWEKPCGGGLSFKALDRYPFLLDAQKEARRVREAEFVAPSGALVRFRLRRPLAIYSRSALNQLLLDRALAAGATLVQDRILGLERAATGWRLVGRQGIYAADYLILAAGARTRLRQRLAADFKARDFMLTFGYYVPAADDVLRIQFFDDFEGYAWSFPRPDHLSIGICGKSGEVRMPELRDRLRGYMRKLGCRSEPGAVFSHVLPALGVESWGGLRLEGPGWALAGDAAGLVDPITGEGIYYAMRSGELIAEALLGDAPASYAVTVRQEFGRALALGARLAPLFYRGDFLGAAVITRMIEFAARSKSFMTVLQDLIEGSQEYTGLAARLYRNLGRSLAEIVVGSLRKLSVVSSQLPVVSGRLSVTKKLSSNPP